MEQNTVQKPDCAAITAQARQAAEELLAAAHLRAGDIFVVGCSSSEIVGGHIGKDSSMEAAAAVLAGTPESRHCHRAGSCRKVWL